MTGHVTWRHAPRGSGGFTYLGLLFAVLTLGFALAAAGTLWSMESRRDREARLLWTGDQYRNAIASYYLQGPMGARVFPPTVQDLLEDRRGPALIRHLRKPYFDPMTGTDWALERAADGTIVGVHSTATGQPLKRAGFASHQAGFAGADCYCKWLFVFIPPRTTLPASAGS